MKLSHKPRHYAARKKTGYDMQNWPGRKDGCAPRTNTSLLNRLIHSPAALSTLWVPPARPVLVTGAHPGMLARIARQVLNRGRS